MFALQQVLRMSRRGYAVAAQQGAKKSRFDNKALKPMILLLIFGSVLTSVTAQQQKHADMVRRYEMKIGILEELIERSKKGDFNYNAEKELELVNKLFARHEKGNSVSIDEEAKLIREQAEKEKLNREKVINSMNSKLEEESFESIFKDIMKEVDQPIDQVSVAPKKLDAGSMKEGSDDIIVDKEWLEYENKREKKSLEFKPSTEKHVIVENAGDYSTAAAQDTEVKRFL